MLDRRIGADGEAGLVAQDGAQIGQFGAAFSLGRASDDGSPLSGICEITHVRLPDLGCLVWGRVRRTTPRCLTQLRHRYAMDQGSSGSYDNSRSCDWEERPAGATSSLMALSRASTTMRSCLQ